MTTEYYVRMYHPSFTSLHNPYYEVAKFEGGKQPTAVYLATPDGACTCPAGATGKSCKHIELVKEFKRLSEPWFTVFWQAEGKWQWYQLLHEDVTRAVYESRQRRRKRK